MTNHEHRHEHEAPRRGLATKWVLSGFILIGGYFLLTEHRAHVISYLPFLLLLACPLLHMFHRHGGHGGGKPDKRDDRPSANPPQGYQGDQR